MKRYGLHTNHPAPSSIWGDVVIDIVVKWILVTVLSLGVMTLAFYLGYAPICDGIRNWLLQTPSTVPLMVAAIHLGQFVSGSQIPPDPCSLGVGWSFFPVYALFVVCVVAGIKKYGHRISFHGRRWRDSVVHRYCQSLE